MADRWPEYDIRCEGACSSCQALLALNMETLKALGIYEENSDKTIVVGPRNTCLLYTSFSGSGRAGSDII